ncbi:MAG: FHA domain-containing protein [Planctomycetota bacterium]|jgi:pSer/pThr/pTyr-binding forkhead associated (FHA) protein|nr:FHA domain-containing protein [Planctomycetota bacterium]
MDGQAGETEGGMGTAGLIVMIGEKDKLIEIPDGKLLFAGRLSECDICLPSPMASRRHAVFIGRNGEYGLKDMDSANGTMLNGKRITQAMRLYDGDVIQIAGFTIKFKRKLPAEAPRTAANRLPRHTKAFLHLDDNQQPRDGQTEQAAAGDSTPKKATDMIPAGSGRYKSDPEIPKQTFEPETPPLAPIQAESQPPPPAPPPKPAPPPPETPLFADDIQDDSEEHDDNAFQIEAAADDSADDALAAINKAAVEANLVGEFVPETDDPPAGGDERAEPAAAAQAGMETGPKSIPVGADMRQAIEARLQLYAFFGKMRLERANILAKNPNLSDPVKAEFARQDRELDKIPTPDQADGMIEKRLAKQADLLRRIAEAEKNGEQPPPKPSKAMQNAEQMAISQWRFCSQSGREALPGVYRACLQLMEDEPLTPLLRAAGQDPLILMGGGAYHLALEALLEETKGDIQLNRAKLAKLPDPAGNQRKKAKAAAADDDDDDMPTESREGLLQIYERLTQRCAWLAQETAFMEKTLIQEFWRVYNELAQIHLPRHEEMPMPIRAYLRHGAIGFKSWWMRAETRDHLIKNCSEDIIHHLKVSKAVTNVIYADEYLAAVANLECTPAMDENLEINERNSPNWKADKALRKLINARSQSALMEELVGSLNERVDKLNVAGSAVDERLGKLLPGLKDFKKLKNELGMQRQALKVEATKLANLASKITNETLAKFKEAEKETDERFASGELPKPTTEFLIRRECEAVHKIARLLANLKERFMPLALRDNFAVGTDAVNDRTSILAEFAEMERRDPSVFLENIVPSKKKASRVDIRISPAIVLLPAAGMLAYSWSPRVKPEDGRLALPTCFIRRRIRERQITYLLSDFRWDTSKAAAGMDVMTSDTIVAAFMSVRWDWRKRSKEGREKGLIYNEQNDRTNWRRVYEAYIQTADDAGKKLFNRNYDFYERIIGKYFDLPEGVTLLKK